MSVHALYPTILVSCPCSESLPAHNDNNDIDDGDEEEEKTFDPRAERSAFSLFPLENLLFCEDCNQVRCPRCVHDEIVCYYCPNCLFEVPSSTVKSEGNRCTRNCFNCPSCSATLGVVPIGEDQPLPADKNGQPSGQVAPGGPWILLCPHCLWSTSDIGIEFEKPTSIAAQLAAKLKGGTTATGNSSISITTPDSALSTPLSPIGAGPGSYFPSTTATDGAEQTDEEAFARLKSHYNHQKAASNSDDYGNSGSLSRLMGLYSTGGGRIRSYGPTALGRNVAKGKSEWQESELREVDEDEELIEKMRQAGFEGTATQEQRLGQGHHPRLSKDIRPIAALLRTKRSKRCRACRHILVKPESKVSTIRYRIRLVAMNYIPALSISRLDASAVSYHNLQPLNTHQFLLTVTNPLFDPISIHLATPEKTPGRFPATVTILCPEFEIGANTDVWDEALQSATSQPKTKPKGKKQALAGTIWDSGRNWTIVIIEIVPPLIPDDAVDIEPHEHIVKVPILVRSVYETDVQRDDGMGREVRERKEHSYWSVLEIGKIGKRLDASAGTAGRPVSVTGSASPVSGREAAAGRVYRHSVK
ncbi:dynactin p62 family-domain-containing protein [Geopyxis carbonaria]|nr:dynactin p62 family-domain-containing protein [Geopyxis carbonaria]